MAVMAGTYNKTKFGGVLRDSGAPIAVCTHSHTTKAEARECSDKAKKALLASSDYRLPADWEPYPSSSSS
jgi:hypothetical protein